MHAGTPDRYACMRGTVDESSAQVSADAVDTPINSGVEASGAAATPGATRGFCRPRQAARQGGPGRVWLIKIVEFPSTGTD